MCEPGYLHLCRFPAKESTVKRLSSQDMLASRHQIGKLRTKKTAERKKKRKKEKKEDARIEEFYGTQPEPIKSHSLSFAHWQCTRYMLAVLIANVALPH